MKQDNVEDSATKVWSACAAECVGTAFLLIAVVGSGIMAERLAQGNNAIALLANSLATGAILFVLIVMFGAQMNPIVTLREAVEGRLGWPRVPIYIGAQLFGAIAGVVLADVMFELPAVFHSKHERGGAGQWLGEMIASAGLLLLLSRTRHQGAPVVASCVGAYIMGAYWFTSSTSFANPAVTLSRTLTDTFAGIAPASAPGFILAQIAGLGVALVLSRMFPNK